MKYLIIFTPLIWGFSMGLLPAQSLQIFQDGATYGLKEKDGKIVQAAIYQTIKLAKTGGFYIATLYQKYGVFDAKGQELLPFEYDVIDDILPGLLIVMQQQRQGLISTKGKVIVPIKYYSITPLGCLTYKTTYSHDAFPKTFEYKGAVIQHRYGGAYGVLNATGKMVIDTVYERLIVVPNYDLKQHQITTSSIIAQKSGQYGLFDMDGTELLPLSSIRLHRIASHGIGIMEKAGKKGIYHHRGAIVYPPHALDVAVLTRKVFAVKQGKKWQLKKIGMNAIENLSKSYDGVWELNERYIGVKKGKFWGAVNVKGRVVIPFKYEEIKPFGRNAQARKGQQWYVYDERGIPIKWQYDEPMVWISTPIPNPHGLEAVSRNGQWGFINDNAQVVIPLEYDFTSGFKNKAHAIVCKGEHCGFIDRTGALKLPIVYQLPDPADMRGSIKIGRTNQWGYLSEDLKFLIPPIYDAVGIYDNQTNYLIAQKKGKWGLLQKHTQTIVLPFEYEYLQEPTPKTKTLTFIKAGQIGEINTKGRVTKKRSLLAYSKNKASVFKNGLKNIQVNRKYGVINSKGEVVIPVKYNAPLLFDGEGLATIRQNYKYGLINEKGKIVIPPIYDDKFRFNAEGRSAIRKGQQFGIIDRQGRIVIPPIYDDYIYPEKEQSKVKKNNRYGILDKDGNTLVPVVYTALQPFIDGLALAQKGDYYGYISPKNEIIIPFIYEEATSFENGQARVKYKGKWGIINPQHQRILPCRYEAIDPTWRQHYIVKKRGKWGMVNENFKLLIPVKYESIIASKHTLEIAQNGKVGLYTYDNQIILPIEYDAITEQVSGHYKVQIGDKFGLFDRNGQLVLAPDFEEINYFTDGICRVKKAGYYGMVNSNGSEMLPCEYERLEQYFQEGRVMAQKDGKWGMVDVLNNITIPFRYENMRRLKGRRVEGLLNNVWEEIVW